MAVTSTTDDVGEERLLLSFPTGVTALNLLDPFLPTSRTQYSAAEISWKTRNICSANELNMIFMFFYTFFSVVTCTK